MMLLFAGITLPLEDPILKFLLILVIILAAPPLPKDAAVTMAYVPLQTDMITYDEDKALQCGTLFPTLNKVFLGGSAK